MTQRARLRRPALERTAPIRNLGKAFDQQGDASSPKTSEASARASTSGPELQDAVSEGVRLGYSVIEDQIRQAQTLAKTLNPGSYDIGGSDEVRSLLNRLLRTYGDLTGAWVDILNAVLGNADLLNAVLGREASKPTEADRSAGAGSPPPTGAQAGGIGAIAFAITSDRPVETEVKFFEGGDHGGPLVVQDLRSRENGAPPLEDVTLVQAGAGGALRFVVRVPAEQPPGLYQGLILDQRTDAPVGALGVTVKAS